MKPQHTYMVVVLVANSPLLIYRTAEVPEYGFQGG